MLTLLAAASIGLASMNQAGNGPIAVELGVNDIGVTWMSYNNGYKYDDSAMSEVDDIIYYRTAEYYGLHVGPRKGGELNNYARRARNWANSSHYGVGLRHK